MLSTQQKSRPSRSGSLDIKIYAGGAKNWKYAKPSAKTRQKAMLSGYKKKQEMAF
jgi:hypothetical protein